MIDHKELRRLALSATPGPWVVPKYSPDEVKTSDDFDGHRIVCSDVTGCPGVQNETDAHYIASASPSVVLALLDEVEAMRGKLKHAEMAAESEARLADEFRKDAERYRWLRDAPIADDAQEWICAGMFDMGGVSELDGEELDSAIDAAMQAKDAQ